MQGSINIVQTIIQRTWDVNFLHTSLLLMLKINIFSSICGRGTRAYNRDACIRFLTDEVDILSFVPSLWSQSFQWGLRFMICDSQNVATWYLCVVKNVNCCVSPSIIGITDWKSCSLTNFTHHEFQLVLSNDPIMIVNFIFCPDRGWFWKKELAVWSNSYYKFYKCPYRTTVIVWKIK